MLHYEIMVDDDTLCFIYKPLGCYSYNTIQLDKKTVKVATIDTMLLFLLAFIYADRPYYEHERIMCMAQYLINVQSKNRLEQKGLLKRFITNCYGNEKTIIEIRSEKAEKYKKLKNENNFREFDKYFYKYAPEKYRPDEDIKIKKKDLKNIDDDNENEKSHKVTKKYTKNYTKKYTKKHRKSKKNGLFGNLF